LRRCVCVCPSESHEKKEETSYMRVRGECPFTIYAFAKYPWMGKTAHVRQKERYVLCGREQKKKVGLHIQLYIFISETSHTMCACGYAWYNMAWKNTQHFLFSLQVTPGRKRSFSWDVIIHSRRDTRGCMMMCTRITFIVLCVHFPNSISPVKESKAKNGMRGPALFEIHVGPSERERHAIFLTLLRYLM